MRRLIPPGLTLVELAVAIAVLALGSVAALQVTDAARRSIGGEEPRLMARLAARNRAEALQVATEPLPAVVVMGRHRITLDTQSVATASGLVEVTIIARAETGEGARLVTWLPGAVP